MAAFYRLVVLYEKEELRMVQHQPVEMNLLKRNAGQPTTESSGFCGGLQSGGVGLKHRAEVRQTAHNHRQHDAGEHLGHPVAATALLAARSSGPNRHR